MNDFFSKTCLGAITLSLAALAYIEVADYRATNQQRQTAVQLARSGTSLCTAQMAALENTLAALRVQLVNVSALVDKTDKSGKVISQGPNPEYEQLLLQMMDVRSQQETLKAECAA